VTLKLSSFALRVLYITPQIALQIGAEFLDACGGENNGVAPTAFSLWGDRPKQSVPMFKLKSVRQLVSSVSHIGQYG